jgi:hypothetical protein
MARRRRARLRVAMIATVLCAAIVGGGAVASAASDGHLPGFSLLDKKVSAAKLPEELRFFFGGIPGVKGTALPHAGQGPFWLGEVRRPNATVAAAASRRWICVTEERPGNHGGSSSCTEHAAARESGLFDINGCGRTAPVHFRIYGLVPDGIESLQVEKEGGAIARSVPVIENTVAFSIGRENVVLRGVGGAAAEEFEINLPLAQAAKLGAHRHRGGCSTYSFFEAKSG